MRGILCLGLLGLFGLLVACQSPVEPEEPDEPVALGELSQQVQSGASYTFPSGSLVIPMDITYQNVGMLKAYGLVYKLLQSRIPVSWVIKPGKALCTSNSPATCSGQAAAADFTVAATDFVTGLPINPAHAYRGGPFVIDQPNAAAAGPIITAWNADPQQATTRTTVHRTTASFTGYVKRQLVAAPTIAMFADGFESVAVSYLVAAGIPDSTGDRAWPASSPDLLSPVRVAGASCPTAPVSLAAAPTGATQSGNTATFTTTAAHGLAIGDIVDIAGVAVAGYRGQMTVTGVPSATTFTAILRATGLAASGGGTVTKSCANTPHNDGALFDSTGTPAYCQMMSMHYGVGDADTIVGREVIREYRKFLQNPVHLFGECQAVNAIENNTDAPFALAQAPAGATQAGTTATFTTTTSHPFFIGEHVLVGGVGVVGYNRTWVITSVPNALTFTAVSSATPAVTGLTPSGAGTVRRYNGLFLTNAGYLIGADPAPIALFNSGEPFTQFDGPFSTVGGSERSYTLPPGETYKAQDIVFITEAPDPGFHDLWMTGYLDGQCSILNEFCDPQFAQGKVSYLGGHQYSTTTPISASGGTQGTRLFLNALLEAPCATDLGAASVNLSKTAPASSTSSAVTYSITAFNNGSAAAGNLVITDTLPANVAFVPSASAAITAIARLTGVVTATTATAHGFAVGARVTVTGVADAAFNGTFSVTQVVSATQFRYAQAGADVSSTGGAVRLARDGVCVGTTAQCSGAGGGVVTFDLGALVAGQSTTVTINVQYATPAVYPNTAQATYKAGSTVLTATSNTTTTCYYAGNPSICAMGCDPSAPKCANGCDDDSDGMIDYPDDMGCDSAADSDEQNYPSTGPVKARVLVVFDTSGSMMWNTCRDEFTGGDGSLACPGADVACSPSPPGCGTLGCGNGIADDARMSKVKSGISNVVNGFGEVEWGLMRFRQLPTQFACGTLNVNKSDGGWQGAGASPCTGLDAGDVVVRFDPENTNSLLAWMDGSSNYPGLPPPGKDFELRASGNTPLGGSLASARTYIAQTRAGEDPQLASCRPYRVILVTDGGETCNGDPAGQAGLLFGAGDGDGRVPVNVIGFSTPNASVQAQLNQIAAAGGTTSYIPADDDAQLSAAIEAIVESTILKELCNDLDDDCDTRIDEDFPDKGSACDNGARGVCRRAGARVCRTDGTGTTCNAPIVTCVAGRLRDQNNNDLGPCTEICNNADDDCDGLVDEAPATNCQACVPSGEICNNADDDCDGIVDENLARQCGTGTCLGSEICIAGTYTGCTAQVPVTETCNGLDDDCDGLRDGLTADCSDLVTMGGPGTDNPGHPSNNPIPQNICRPGQKTCPANVGPPNAFSACSGEITPCNGFTPCTDPCNGIDDDCDNLIDEDFAPSDCSTSCGVGQTVCLNGQLSCNAVPAPSDDTCNNTDDDCDGMIDEDYVSPGACGGGVVCNGLERCVNGQVTCVGDPIGVESCNCLDDNCNGVIDEGALCQSGASCVNCQCAYQCGEGEFPCPLGKKCSAGFCVVDPCSGVTCPVVNGNDQSCVDQGGGTYACVDTCTLKQCPPPAICHGPSGECRPDNCTTFPERCGPSQVCLDGTCVANPCDGVVCPGGAYCVGGVCVGSCGGVECPAGQRCKLGVCESDPCGEACPKGEVCNDTSGLCVDDPCRLVQCSPGQWCNPSTGGKCETDPCVASGVTCPEPDQICRGGTCYAPAPPRTDTFVTTGGGGGCAAGGDAGWLLGLALLGLSRRRSARRTAARLATAGLFAMIATSLACKVNDYCLDCVRDDGGTTDPDADGSVGGDGGECIPAGGEVCDGKDNDCNGQIDDGALPGAGVPCTNQQGECVGATQTCTNGMLRCSKVPTPEICDRKDNNCNGQIDEGDPGGGATCGTNVGECVAGVNHCNAATGQIECVGFLDRTGNPELCNGKDDDCDGNFDEGISSVGSCGPATNTGECNIGSLMCQAGSVVCMNAVYPAFEICNSKDDDCDGQADEIYDFTTDPLHCGNCTTVCGGHANSVARCVSSACTFTCNAGYHDLNPAIDGCEYGPCFATGAEECDGADNDCDGIVDESLTPPQICLQGGACGAAVPACNGAGGWRCNYPPDVQTDGAGHIVPETKCDGVDNDCDTRTDEGQPNLGQACSDGELGACRGTGELSCNPSDLNGPVVCVNMQPGGMAGPELCNGQDDDCDGTLDEGAPDAMVEVRDASNVLQFKVYAYEASRPDATASAGGIQSHRSCSSPLVRPWSTVTQTEAASACAAAGKRLCTATEWQLACAGNSGRRYPYGATYQPNTCNGNDYDPNCALPDDDVPLPTGAAHGCPAKPAQSACVSPSGAFDLSGNVKEWTSTAAGTNVFQVRGGGFDSAPGGLACDFAFVSMNQSFAFPNLGFRCCQDP